MRDFNTVRHELVQHLQLSWQGEDGVIRMRWVQELMMKTFGDA